MREITQVQEFQMRGLKAVKKVQSIIKSGKAREIIVEDESGDAIFRFVPDVSFLSQTLNMLKGTMKVIKACKITVMNKQTVLFN
ncbi:MAG TPA: hypothetical protein VGQ87_00575 [Patescibacteria group bacterium]|jgi:hypothetical protein|nr:hypothetical protein [Patescibacteria group bacterium]